MLDLHELSKSFDGIHAVDRVSLSFKQGEITAIIGPNGAGKTTLLNLITGFLTPDEGTIEYRRSTLLGLRPHRIARLGIVRTFQDLRLIRQMSVKENLLLASDNGREHDNILATVGLRGLEAAEAGTLSYGQQKLLSIACCLAAGGECFLLDEPVAGVHPNLIGQILLLLQRLRQDGKTVIFIEHDLDAVRSAADTVVVMHQGQIIAKGTPVGVLGQANVVDAYLE
jgi:ABC-type branched-subunit amino acid transport system ATPase component